MKTLCFTGHRPNRLGGYDPNNPIITEVHNRLWVVVQKAIDAGFTHFISGGALGVDQVAARVVLDYRAQDYPVQLIIARPFIGQEKKWPWESQKHYLALLRAADQVETISPGGYTVQKMQIRDEWMIDQSDAAIAVWDGTHSGTGNTVNYARDKKPVYHINPVSWEEKWIGSPMF